MSEASADRSPNLESLSALVDGELDPASVSPLCGAWRNDAAVRGRWHAYQLIGDVLRSDDLAGRPERDRAFLAALHQRLEREPVVLAPSQPVAPARVVARRRWGWRAPSAVAAGFVAVAGTVLVLQQQPGQAPAQNVVRAPAPTPVAVAPATAVAPAVMEAPAVVPAGVIRDARLDRYLAAHKQFAGSSALGAPSGYLRAATVDGAPR